MRVNSSKRDNSNMPEKIEIRAWALKEAALDEVRVLDLCAGEGHIWRALRERFRVHEYVPVDQAPRFPGTIKGEANAELLESIHSERYNVIDIDTYGRPWSILAHAAPRIVTRTALMLTSGRTSVGRGTLSIFEREAMGIPLDWQYVANSMVGAYADRACLWRILRRLKIVSAMKTRLPQVSYYALVVEPKREGEDDGREDGDRVDG